MYATRILVTEIKAGGRSCFVHAFLGLLANSLPKTILLVLLKIKTQFNPIAGIIYLLE